MSTHSTVKTEALHDLRSIIDGCQNFLPGLIKAQEGTKVTVTYNPKARNVRMHNTESTVVNRGTLEFSDTVYNIGIQEHEDGSLSLEYDSWVSDHLLERRINGKSKNEPANIKTAQAFERASMHARRLGKTMRTAVVEDRLMAFVPA